MECCFLSFRLSRLFRCEGRKKYFVSFDFFLFSFFFYFFSCLLYSGRYLSFSLSRHRGFASRGIVHPVPRTRGLDPLGTCEGVSQYVEGKKGSCFGEGWGGRRQYDVAYYGVQIDGHVSGITCHDGQIHCTISSDRLSVDLSL